MYCPSETGGLKSNCSGSFPSKTCLGIIHAAFQRTVNSEWKREFGFFSLKMTVYLSGASMLSTLSWNCALRTRPWVFRWVLVVKTTSSAVNSTPSLQ